MKTTDDPIFAAIEAHKAATKTWDADRSKDCDAVTVTFAAIVDTEPTTVEGYLAKARALVNEDDPLNFAGMTEALLGCAAMLYAAR